MNSMQNILFLDVETVSQLSTFDEIDGHGRQLWKQKIGYMARREEREWLDEDFSNSYKDKAAIYAEFGKIIVISAGIITQTKDGPILRIKSFYGYNEKEILQSFCALLQQKFNDANYHVLCGHNIREFDIPYLCRRFCVNEINLPSILSIAGKKPWEIKFICDTLELWKYGDHKNYTSLDLLAYTLGISSPKENLDGSKVGECYWNEKNLEKIKQYCERDVLTVAQVYLRMHNMPLIQEEQVVITN